MMNDFNLNDELQKFTKHWKWFVFSVVLSLILGFVVVRYSTPSYKAQGKIKIVENDNSGTGIDLFKELDVFSGSQNKVEDEIEIIASRSNIIEVVQQLGLNTKVFLLGNIKSTELYHDSPVTLNIISPDSVIYKAEYDFYLELDNTFTSFGFAEEENDPTTSYAFGKSISTPIGEVVITPKTELLEKYKDKKFKVEVRPISNVTTNYKNNIKVSVPREFSNILDISLEDPVREKARDVINTLISIYNKNAIEDKQRIADKTSSFIEGRIADISTNLSSVDQSAQDFKTGRGVTDIASEANINLNVGVANRQELANAETQLNIAASMKDMVDQQDSYEVLPANLGLSDPTINNTTQQWNQLVQERNKLLKSSNEKNPVIVNLDQQLRGLKQTMQASLNSTVNNLGLQVNTLSGQQAIINSKIYAAPEKERALRDITRRQQTTESLYLYLLQKREEAQIAVASTAPKSQLIDSAYYSDIPVAPRKKIIYLIFALLGFVVPFSVIYAVDLLDNKVNGMRSLEKQNKNIPIIGELPRLTKKESKIVVKNDRSVLAEALRIVRANLDYLLKTKNDKQKRNVVFVTSSVPGEGKTFFSVNLAMILASTNKKVLLIGGDVRNPKIKSFFDDNNIEYNGGEKSKKQLGLTDYLHKDDVGLKDILNSLEIHDNKIDIVYSGATPPNPSELLMDESLEELFQKASSHYDYVIVDTAPMMVVSDTLLISKYADQLVYVTRAGKTETKLLDFPIRLQEEGKIGGLSFIVNDVKLSNLGYGGKYGYGYGKTAKKWWQF